MKTVAFVIIDFVFSRGIFLLGELELLRWKEIEYEYFENID
jgi:hypothetical protein